MAAREGNVVDIVYLLDRLDEIVANARRVPFSHRVIVDEQDYTDVVDQIRLALPEEIKLARRVMAEREQILAEANERAEQLVERAERQAAHRTEDHVLAQAAEDRAQALVEQAEREADEIRSEADAYARRVFSSLQNRLQQIDAVVQEALQELSIEPTPPPFPS